MQVIGHRRVAEFFRGHPRVPDDRWLRDLLDPMKRLNSGVMTLHLGRRGGKYGS
jgi:hypothetical protein